MVLQTQSLTTHILPLISVSTNPSRPSHSLSKPNKITNFNRLKTIAFRKPSFQAPRCSLSVASEPSQLEFTSIHKPFPAEVSRTIMELSSVGTLSTLTQEGWPSGIGVHFAVDHEGTPVLCLNPSNWNFSLDKRSSLHVQLEQCGLRVPQCTIQGSLEKPEDRMALKKFHSIWKKRFGEEVNEEFIYIVAAERILQIEDFMEDGVWVSSLDYKIANPDPLRDVAEKILNEINTHNMEDVYRFCNIYVELDFQFKETKMVWVDRLGFDIRLSSPRQDIFEVRIPFPSEVTDEKGVKSYFNGMSQLAWEVDKNYGTPDFKKVKQLKKIKYRGHWM